MLVGAKKGVEGLENGKDHGDKSNGAVGKLEMSAQSGGDTKRKSNHSKEQPDGLQGAVHAEPPWIAGAEVARNEDPCLEVSCRAQNE